MKRGEAPNLRSCYAGNQLPLMLEYAKLTQQSIMTMDYSENKCSFSGSSSFLKEDTFPDSNGWFVTKSKKKSIKGTWSSRLVRNLNSEFFDDAGSFKFECGIFKYNMKKDVLKLYVSGNKGCFRDQAKGGRKQFLGKLKLDDAEDLFGEGSGPLQITSYGSVTRKNDDDPKVKIDNMMLFKSANSSDSGDVAVHIKDSYVKGLGKFESKMGIDGELQTRSGMTFSDFEEYLMRNCQV